MYKCRFIPKTTQPDNYLGSAASLLSNKGCMTVAWSDDGAMIAHVLAGSPTRCEIAKRPASPSPRRPEPPLAITCLFIAAPSSRFADTLEGRLFLFRVFCFDMKFSFFSFKISLFYIVDDEFRRFHHLIRRRPCCESSAYRGPSY